MVKFKLYPAFIVFSFILCLGCSKEEIRINNADDFASYIMDEMEYQHIPAMSVLIFRDETILYERYFGYSNVQQQKALADDHLFLIASISKVITATALLQLYDQGLFNLDDPINDHLPFSVRVPGYSREISFRMLLTHTSGIEDNFDVLDDQYYYNQDPPVALSYFIENYMSPGGVFYHSKKNFYDFNPGTRHEYSNVGNALIAVLVENISGEEFNQYCKENIFNPLGMHDSYWRLDEIIQTIVTPYDFYRGNNHPIQHYTFTDYPNGGLRTTARDLFTFVSTLANNGQTGSFQLLNPSTVQAMITPQIPSIDDEVGLHLFIMNKNYNLWGHDGGEQGVATIMAFNPDTKTGVVILSNQGEADLDNLLEQAYKFGLIL